MDILKHAMASLDGQFSSYALGYDKAKTAAAALKVGDIFYGAYGFADRYAGATPSCRETPEWKGARDGYLDGLKKAAITAVIVDGNGRVTSTEG